VGGDRKGKRCLSFFRKGGGKEEGGPVSKEGKGPGEKGGAQGKFPLGNQKRRSTRGERGTPI